MSNQKTFIYVEGRENILPFMADDIKRATLKFGWNYRQLLFVNPNDLIDDNRMNDIFPPNCAVILRNLPKNSTIEVDMLTHWLNKRGILTINFNATGGLEASNDKLFEQLMFKLDKKTCEYAIPTFEAQTKENVVKLLINQKIKYPFLLKPRDGSIGRGIIIIKNETELSSQTKWSNMLVQNYIDSDYDWRVYTVGNKAVGALRRGGKTKKLYDFNAYANGIEKSKETNPEILFKINQIACNAAFVAGLEYSGCDIIRDRNTGKYYILEINTAATWEGGYSDIIGVDIATEILKWCDDKLGNLGKTKKV